MAIVPRIIIASVLCILLCACERPVNTVSPELQSDGVQAASLPNIVFIFADDQSPHTIGAYGNAAIKTPNLDSLAKRGVNFSHAYNMGGWNGAVCIASRAMLNSGRAIWQAQVMDGRLQRGEGVDTLWAKRLEKQGYDTYMTGKWHVSADADLAFQTTAHVRPGMPQDTWDHEKMVQLFEDFYAGKSPFKTYEEFIPLGYNRPKSEQDKSWSPTDTAHGGFYEGGLHWSEVLKNNALEFIDRAKNRDNPFFMYLAFNAPHDPRQAPQEYQDMYPVESMRLPDSWQALYPEREAIENGPDLRDAALAPFPRTKYATQVHLKEYYAIISHLDTQVGEILKALEASGKMDNTYIIYTADHGLAVGEHGLFGKQNMYEHSVRVPFIIWGPGIEGGRTVSADVYIQDVMPTTLELANLEKPDDVFFNSILSLAKGSSTQSAYDSIYGAYIESQRMIKKDGFKLIVYPTLNTVKLFDLENDALEMQDLSSDEKYKERVIRLFEELINLQKSMGDQLNLSSVLEHIRSR